jgi:hypothetical protein
MTGWRKHARKGESKGGNGGRRSSTKGQQKKKRCMTPLPFRYLPRSVFSLAVLQEEGNLFRDEISLSFVKIRGKRGRRAHFFFFFFGHSLTHPISTIHWTDASERRPKGTDTQSHLSRLMLDDQRNIFVRIQGQKISQYIRGYQLTQLSWMPSHRGRRERTRMLCVPKGCEARSEKIVHKT